MSTRVVSTETTIATPRPHCWAVLTRLDEYRSWNPALVPRDATIRVGVGTPMTLLMQGAPLGIQVPISVQLDRVDAPSELRWTGGLRGILRAWHSFQLEEDSPTTTRLVHRERFEGPILPLFWKSLKPRLESRYEAYNRAFRTRCESTWSSEMRP